MEQEDWELGLIKCRENPYYFATTYLVVDGKPFTTPMTELAFNDYFNKLSVIPDGRRTKKIFEELSKIPQSEWDYIYNKHKQ